MYAAWYVLGSEEERDDCSMDGFKHFGSRIAVVVVPGPQLFKRPGQQRQGSVLFAGRGVGQILFLFGGIAVVLFGCKSNQA